MEEDYDILGVYVLGLVTAFGGGVIRNLLIGKPIVLLWEQGIYFQIALFAMTLVFFMPVRYIKLWKTWEAFFDAIGLAAFSIQGATYATNMGHPLSAIIVAAVLTGIGGGIVRDVLAGRKPLVLKDEIYAVWGMLAGALVGLGWAQGTWQLAVLFALVVILRMFSVFYKWKLPKRSLRSSMVQTARRSDL